jgi:general secretion pathway protein G
METNVSTKFRALKRAAARGVTLVEVLIVVAIMAVIAGGATILVFPQFKKARCKSAVIGAGTIKQAADLYQNLNGTADVCPTIQDLVNSRSIDAKKTDDPWGSPYKIICVDGEIHVISPGNDKRENTPDDLRDDMKPSEVEKIANL